MCTFDWRLTGSILLALTSTSCGEDAAQRFVAEDDGFSVVMPGPVTSNQLDPVTRQYSCSVKVSETKRIMYLITAAKAEDGGDSMAQLRKSRDNGLMNMKKEYPDLTLVWSTPIRCSGYPGLQFTYVFDKIKRGSFGEGFELPSGSDVRLIRAGNRIYILMVYEFVYDGLWTLATGCDDTPKETKQFFASFRLLKKLDVPAATEKETIVGEWVTQRQEKQDAEQDGAKPGAPLGLLTGSNFVFYDNGAVLMAREHKGTYKTSDNQDPQHIDLVFPADGTITGKKQGIYKITEDSLTLCVANATSDTRPTRFEGTDKQTLWILSRPGDAVLPAAGPAGSPPSAPKKPSTD